jgi:hypothetical protein
MLEQILWFDVVYAPGPEGAYVLSDLRADENFQKKLPNFLVVWVKSNKSRTLTATTSLYASLADLIVASSRLQYLPPCYDAFKLEVTRLVFSNETEEQREEILNSNDVVVLEEESYIVRNGDGTAYGPGASEIGATFTGPRSSNESQRLVNICNKAVNRLGLKRGEKLYLRFNWEGLSKTERNSDVTGRAAPTGQAS